jgi:hypothetical protein
VIDVAEGVMGRNSIGLLSEIQCTRGMQFRETPGDYAFDWCGPLSNCVQSILSERCSSLPASRCVVVRHRVCRDMHIIGAS